MGQRRWERCRARTGRDINKFNFRVIDLTLITLLFAGLWFLRIFSIHTSILSDCAAQIAHFGAGYQELPAFKLLLLISFTMFVLWAVALTIRTDLRTRWGKAFQAALLGGILTMGFFSYHMSSWDNVPMPDGTLATSKGIWDTRTAPPQWRQLPGREISLKQAALEYPNQDIDAKETYTYPEHKNRECIFVDQGLITVSDTLATKHPDGFISDYLGGRFNYNQVTDLQGRHLLDHDTDEDDYDDPFSTKNSLGLLFSRKSMLDKLIAFEQVHTRPITDNDLKRFIDKQACLKTKADTGFPYEIERPFRILEYCDSTFGPPLPE